MQGPSAIALRQGGQGGALKYKLGVQVVCTIAGGGAPPAAWRKKTTLQGVFGDFGQVLEIHIQEDGTAIIEYDDQRDAQDASESMDGKRICGVAVDVKVRTENNGSFGGRKAIDDRVSEMAQRYGLDATSAARLVSAFKDRSRRGCNLDMDIKQLGEHLAASNKPSALVCMKLADLREGKPIGACKFSGDRAPGRGDRNSAKGGEKGEQESQQRHHRSRSRSPKEKNRKRSRSRSRKKSRSKSRKKSRSRSRKRSREKKTRKPSRERSHSRHERSRK